MDRYASLRWRFLGKVFGILIVIAAVAGITQIIMIKSQINQDIQNQTNLISKGIIQNIDETNRASKAIEHQIDLKLVSFAQYIADDISKQKSENITQKDLINIRDELNLAGITLLMRQEDDIVAVQATDPDEIGFSFKKIGYLEGHQAMDALLKGQKPEGGGTLVRKNLSILPITQSGSHGDEPAFFKYGYYHPEGSDYIISPYITANEVYQFTNEVGPESWISEMVDTNPYIEEIAVLNVPVFKDPSLETKLYPPLKKIEYGMFEYQNESDVETLVQMDTLSNVNFIHKINGKKVYKMFVPINEEQMVYIGLDYNKLSGPLYRHASILILSGLLALLALFLLTARFFNQIYENIQRIRTQIKLLEAGDFSAKSNVKDGSDLEKLSESANHMVDTLHQVLKDTSNQATKIQRMSVMVEADAAQSVEQMYTLSMDATTKARDQLSDIMDFLDNLEKYIDNERNAERKSELHEQVEMLREIAKDRTASTTEITLTLSDLLKSLHGQSSDLSNISNNLMRIISKFKLRG